MSDIWYMLRDCERYVYHYTRASTLADSILPSGQIRFSRFQHVNDPRESKDWLFSYRSERADLNFAVGPIETKLNQLLKQSWRVGCFASDPYEALVTRAREDRGEDILGALYERGHSRPRMWAQYGDDYSGACLIFEKATLDADIRSFCKGVGSTVHAGKVVYRNPRVVPNLTQPDALTISVDEINRLGFADAIEAHISRHWQDLFFVKARDWEQEREFRWLVRGNGDEDFYVAIRNSLVGIALGDRFPNPFKVAVGHFCESHGTSVAVINWQNGVPQPRTTHWRLLLEP